MENEVVKLSKDVAPGTIHFNMNGVRVGTLYEGDGALKFEGDADASAKVFMEFVIEKYSLAITQREETIAALQREVRYLRHYGNKDCTHQADEAMISKAMEC